MALSNDELLQVENYLSSKGIHCDDAGTTVDTADKVLAINSSKAGKYYTILQLIEKAIDSGKATFYTESEIDGKVETINSSISSEASTRASEDASLSSDISSEATARENADALKLNTADLLDKVYPVGSIYMSLNSVSPASFIGGTWQRLASRFLYGGSELKEYTTADQNGASSVTLTTANMPAHTHTRGTMDITGSVKYILTDRESSQYTCSGAFSTIDAPRARSWSGTTGDELRGFSFKASDNWSGATSSVGSGAAFSILPPYQLVNIWYRTA